jgi:RNA polymerase sigma-70 factor (ECF subfamily)
MVSVAAAVDGAVLETLYREDGDRLWRALLAFAGDAEVASDAVAEAFAQALRRGGAIHDAQAWIWRAGFRIAAGDLKKRASTSVIPDVSYLDPAVDQELLDAVAQLPAGQRAAVVLFYYLDAPIRDVARRTGTSQLAVRANLSRGRKRLKQLLGESK